MIIGKRIRQLREQKALSQEDIEQMTGLPTGYMLRVENGQTVPSLEALERLGSALEIPLYQLFYEGDEPPVLPGLSKGQTTKELVMEEESEKEMRFLEKFLRITSRIDEKDRPLVPVPLRPMLVLETKDGGEEGYLRKLYKPGSGPWWVIAMVVGTLLLALLGSIFK
jgi:transcriptional regulator with XRE-family HTH domain